MNECMEQAAVYTCIDRENNNWQCSCGYMERFEADGPVENGWNVCPSCGRSILVSEEE